MKDEDFMVLRLKSGKVEFVMKAALQIDAAQVEQMELTITMTTTVHEWRAVMKAQPREYPGWRVAATISKALDHIDSATGACVEVDG